MNAMNTPLHTVDEDAPVVVRLSTVVDAPLATVWALHTDIGSWADWNTDIESVDFTGPLAPGASFRWLTHGLDITSTVSQVVPAERSEMGVPPAEGWGRIVWGGPAHGIDGVHVWTFEETGDGAVTVRTEESWAGAPVEERPEELRQALRQSLESWLGLLKSEAERRG